MFTFFREGPRNSFHSARDARNPHINLHKHSQPCKETEVGLMKMEELPQTLRQALSNPGNMWSNLWKLAVFLRCGEDGMDGAFLKKAEVVRERARKLNWHQPLVCPVAGGVGSSCLIRCLVFGDIWCGGHLVSNIENR